MRMCALAILAIALGLAGCDPLRGGGVAIVDLDAVARALGRDEAIEQRVGSANEQLSSQLDEVA